MFNFFLVYVNQFRKSPCTVILVKARHLDFLSKSIVSVFITKIHYCQPHYCSTIKYIQVKNTLNNSSKDDQIHLNSLWIKEFAMALDCNTSGWCNNCSLSTGIKIQESHRNLYSATTGSPNNRHKTKDLSTFRSPSTWIVIRLLDPLMFSGLPRPCMLLLTMIAGWFLLKEENRRTQRKIKKHMREPTIQLTYI